MKAARMDGIWRVASREEVYMRGMKLERTRAVGTGL
jgi:hypothetical protein